MKKKIDLARDLADPQIRKDYLHSKKRPFSEILRYIYRDVIRNRALVAASVGYALCSGLLPLLSVLLVYELLRMLESPEPRLAIIIGFISLYALVFFLLSAISVHLEQRHYSFFMTYRISWMNKVMRQYMKMDFGLFENKDFLDDLGNWGRSLQSNTQGLEGSLHKFFSLGGSFASALFLGVLLFTQSPWIILVALAFIVVSYFLQKHILLFKHAHREELVSLSRRSHKLTEAAADFRYGKDLRIYRLAELFTSRFAPLMKSYEKLMQAFTLRSFQLSFPETLALLMIDLVSLSILLGRLSRAEIRLPQFIMLLSAVTLFSQMVQESAKGLTFIKGETLYISDTIDLLEADLVSRDGEMPPRTTATPELLFEDVSFRYPGSETFVLRHLKLKIGTGEKLALVGVNGAGKTSLVKLLTGLYRPTEGRILLDGADTSLMPSNELFSLFGVVFQDCSPLALTVAENIAATDEQIDRKRVESSLRQVGLWEKISSFERGMDQPLLRIVEDDGVILSGGENQKLAMARALYREGAELMVMDEPTAALDALAEEKIYREFDEILSGRTALFISHRLASTRFCDRIVLLDGGEIREEGSHEELMEKGGLYAHMFRTQAKYYQETAPEDSRENED